MSIEGSDGTLSAAFYFGYASFSGDFEGTNGEASFT
jgi:hypothetical protein